MKPYLFLLFFITTATYSWGQEDIENTPSKDTLSVQLADTLAVKEKKHSPKVAGCLSIVPGLGQAYNKKYWKIPIVYAGLVGGAYGINYFSMEYIAYRNEYRNRINYGKRSDKDKFRMDDANIAATKQYNQKYLQLSILLTSVWYFVNILDAVVDAHLMSFDISHDLSMNIAPAIDNGFVLGNGQKVQTVGLSFTFNFK